MAWGNESSSSSESDSDDEIPSYDEIVQQNLKYAKVCTSQQKKLKILKEELGSSKEAQNFSSKFLYASCELSSFSFKLLSFFCWLVQTLA